MKPFDLKAAQAGEPIQTRAGTAVRFVGLMRDGRVVIEKSDCSIGHVPTYDLCMAPKKLMINIEITFRNGVIHSSWVTQKTHLKQQDGPEWQYRYSTIEVDAP